MFILLNFLKTVLVSFLYGLGLMTGAVGVITLIVMAVLAYEKLENRVGQENLQAWMSIVGIVLLFTFLGWVFAYGVQ